MVYNLPQFFSLFKTTTTNKQHTLNHHNFYKYFTNFKQEEKTTITDVIFFIQFLFLLRQQQKEKENENDNQSYKCVNNFRISIYCLLEVNFRQMKWREEEKEEETKNTWTNNDKTHFFCLFNFKNSSNENQKSKVIF